MPGWGTDAEARSFALALARKRIHDRANVDDAGTSMIEFCSAKRG